MKINYTNSTTLLFIKPKIKPKWKRCDMIQLLVKPSSAAITKVFVSDMVVEEF